MEKKNTVLIIILFIASLFMTISSQQADASIEDADIKRLEGLYKDAITEYKEYEDFYNYNLMRNVDKPELYREYSRLLAEILLKIAESYDEWERYRGVEAYCDKIIILSNRIGKDKFIDPIKKQAKNMLSSLGKPVSTSSGSDKHYSEHNDESLYISSDTNNTNDADTNNENEKISLFVNDSENTKEKEDEDPIINSEEIEIPDDELDEKYSSYKDYKKKKEEPVKFANVDKYGEMSEDEFIRLEREDEKSLLADEPITEEELDKTMSDLENYLALLDDTSSESTTIEDDPESDEFTLSDTDVATLDDTEDDMELPDSFEVFLDEEPSEEDSTAEITDNSHIEDDDADTATIADIEDDDTDIATIADIEEPATPIIEDGERPTSTFELEDTETELELIEEQKLDPNSGPVTSQLLSSDKYEKSSIIMHLTKFGQVLSTRIEKPTYVKISDSDNNMLEYSETKNEIEVNSLTTENVRIYLSLNLSNDYDDKQLEHLSTSLTQFLLSLPLGYSVYLSLINGSDVDFVSLNTENLFNIDTLLKDDSNLSTNNLLKLTYNQISKDDNIYKSPRFLLLISDKPDVINIGVSKQANELSVPLHIFSISESLSDNEIQVLSRISSNTFGTYSNGDMETKLVTYLYNIALYLVQGSFILSWDSNAFSSLDNLTINIKFLYNKQAYEMIFDTSLMPIIY